MSGATSGNGEKGLLEMAAQKSSAIEAVSKVVARVTRRGVASDTSTTTVADGVPARKTPGKKPGARKSGGKDAVAKTAPANKAAANGTAETKAPAKKAPAKKAPAKRDAAKGATSKAAPVKKSAAKKAQPKAAPVEAAPVEDAPVEAAPTRRAPALAVRPGEKPWTVREIDEVRALLHSDQARLEAEISAVDEEIGELLREGGEGAGHDQADVGSTTFERDHEMSIVKNARDNLVLVLGALDRIDDGTYGVCEVCGNPIGKMRLQAFPRATLCMECKQRQERR